MAGVTMAEGRAGRRPLDSELNMVPMIDLLMVTVAFLLVTAVWSRMGRLEGDADVPGVVGPSGSANEPRLHVEMGDPAKIVLHWNVGPTVIRTSEIPKREAVSASGSARAVRFPELRAKLEEEWRAAGFHRDPKDTAFDEIVLHTADDAPYSEIVGAMDAAYGVERACSGGRRCPAFRVVFASR